MRRKFVYRVRSATSEAGFLPKFASAIPSAHCRPGGAEFVQKNAGLLAALARQGQEQFFQGY